MNRRTQNQYEALAEFRYLMLHSFNKHSKAAKTVGLKSRQYLLLLHLQGFPGGQRPTITALAERLQSNHNTVVELVNRSAKNGLVRKQKAAADGRNVFVHSTAKGRRLSGRAMDFELAEFKTNDACFVRALRRAIAKMG